jgi:hypothetical protein
MQSDDMALPDEVSPIARNGISQKNDANLAPHVDIRLRKDQKSAMRGDGLLAMGPFSEFYPTMSDGSFANKANKKEEQLCSPPKTCFIAKMTLCPQPSQAV